MVFEEFQSTKNIRLLNGIRCFCILAVLWHHTPFRPESFPRVTELGFLGVDMFFVLSGFLIVTLMLREKRQSGTINLKNFYVRRSLRIFPVYYLLVLATFVLYVVFMPESEGAKHMKDELPYLLTYTSNWIHVESPNLDIAWSLAVEEQFYLLWPSIQKLLPPQVMALVMGFGLVLNQLINFGVLDNYLYEQIGLSQVSILDTTFTPILFGVVLAHALNRKNTYDLILKFLGKKGMATGLLVAMLAVMHFSPTDISGAPRLIIQILMVLFLASVVVNPDNFVAPLLEFKPVDRIGVVSYGMYLYHMWSILIANKLFSKVGFENAVAVFILGSIITYIISELSFRFFETPFLKLKKYFY